MTRVYMEETEAAVLTRAIMKMQSVEGLKERLQLLARTNREGATTGKSACEQGQGTASA